MKLLAFLLMNHVVLFSLLALLQPGSRQSGKTVVKAVAPVQVQARANVSLKTDLLLRF